MSRDLTHVIIGAGQAGGAAAYEMRKCGFAGRIVLIGDEGHPPYERPPLSKAVLLGQADAVSTYMAAPEAAEPDMGHLLHPDDPVVSLCSDPPSVRLRSGATLRFDKLLFATGGQARRLDLPGAELDGVHYLRSLADAMALRNSLAQASRIVVVGGGFLGLEVAAAARQLGKHVTVLETAGTVLSRALAPELGDIVAQFHRKHGTDIVLRRGLTAIEGRDGHVDAVICGDEKLPCDLVVVSIGIIPNDALARGLGLRTDNGILVNEFGETSLPRFYAAGDVANHYNPLLDRRLRLESWQNAQNQAAAVARVMCGERTAYSELPWFWSDQFDLNIQMLGAPTDWDRICYRGLASEFRFSAFYIKDGKVVAMTAFNKGNEVGAARQLILRALDVPLDKLVDPAVDLRKLVRGL